MPLSTIADLYAPRTSAKKLHIKTINRRYVPLLQTISCPEDVTEVKVSILSVTMTAGLFLLVFALIATFLLLVIIPPFNMILTTIVIGGAIAVVVMGVRNVFSEHEA